VPTDADDSGLFSSLWAKEVAGEIPPTWSCHCTGCAELPGAGETGAGANSLGEYATTPGETAYRFVAQAMAPLQGSEGSVAALMAGSKWSGIDAGSAKTIITYSFADPHTSTFAYGSANPEFQATLSGFSEADRELTREMLASIEAVCNVRFVEVQDNSSECGVLRYGYSQQPNSMNYAGYAFYPSASSIGGDIWIGAAQARAEWDFYRPNLILHETLHALGLKHPFSTGAVLSSEQNLIANTVMSYSTVVGSTSGSMSLYPSRPMPLDIAALQYMYGAADSNSDHTVYDLAGAEFQNGFHVVWDSAGVDLFDASRATQGVTLNLNEGARSDVGASVWASGKVGANAVSVRYTETLAVAEGAVIENAKGSQHADVLVGNGASNTLWGEGGNDVLQGHGGNDMLIGGAGDDMLDGGAGLDAALYDAARSAHTVTKTDAGYTVSGITSGNDRLTGVERLSFSDTSLALDLDGNAGIAAKVLGLIFGGSAVQNKSCVGLCLTLLDNGMAYEELLQLGLNVRLGSGAGNAAVAGLIDATVPGTAQHLLGLLNAGAYTQTALARMAADCYFNVMQIDLVGLQANGIEYIA
jgi:serralysin